ncbi:hypothetical protein [Roseicyclus sp.]|uniref:hypothetical protein n=1 Tax=Roseicyclus sp. TaxID=1914329 RepID=UPI003FA1494B
MTPSGSAPSRISVEADGDEDRAAGMFNSFDRFLERLPAWLFHSLGIVTALVSLWFALALLGGLPGGLAEWVVLAMFGVFSYAVGFMIPLLVAYLVESRTRLSMVLIAAGSAVGAGAVALQGVA